MSPQEQCIHATCIAYGDRGALLIGPSGAGKSDLALRMISHSINLPQRREPSLAPGLARLVSDDQVLLGRKDDRLWARAPAPLRGLLEVRGLGIVRVDFLPEAPIRLVVELVSHASIERMPDPHQFRIYLDVAVPLIRLHAFDVSAPLKLALALGGISTISK